MSEKLKRGYYVLHTDAGMASNGHRKAGDPSGVAAIGGVLRTPSLSTLDHLSKKIGRATHSEAEYRGLIEGLKLARRHGIERIRVYMDSELVVEQMNGRSSVKQAQLIKRHYEAKALEAEFKSIRFSWVPREMNREADELARDALNAA